VTLACSVGVSLAFFITDDNTGDVCLPLRDSDGEAALSAAFGNPHTTFTVPRVRSFPSRKLFIMRQIQCANTLSAIAVKDTQRFVRSRYYRNTTQRPPTIPPHSDTSKTEVTMRPAQIFPSPFQATQRVLLRLTARYHLEICMTDRICVVLRILTRLVR
jgi:hypothetical protein